MTVIHAEVMPCKREGDLLRRRRVRFLLYMMLLIVTGSCAHIIVAEAMSFEEGRLVELELRVSVKAASPPVDAPHMPANRG